MTRQIFREITHIVTYVTLATKSTPVWGCFTQSEAGETSTSRAYPLRIRARGHSIEKNTPPFEATTAKGADSEPQGSGVETYISNTYTGHILGLLIFHDVVAHNGLVTAWADTDVGDTAARELL